MATQNHELEQWVRDVRELTEPDRVYWCTGSDEENAWLLNMMIAEGTLKQLNPETHPNCYLHLSDLDDVARVEHLTYVCTTDEEDAGPNNNWMNPHEAHELVDELFAGAMKGRTMYVVPYVMGLLNSPYARAGVEITDSPYVVANMRIMTRMGKDALTHIERTGTFVKGLHSLSDLNPERRFIMHFPEEDMIKSIGSGYGGNALLGKKCHALRIASWQARQEGWLAEHMLIMGIENPQGEVTYIAAAFPSACGKTNLAMLIPPESYKGWKVWTVGDDIAWMHIGDDGRLWAINPEAGFFGVVPGTSNATNPNIMACLNHDVIFTNVAETRENEPWWEGKNETSPEGLTNWKGETYNLEMGPAAHPNSRFTVRASQCPSYSPRANVPEGVPISAIIFGGRRTHLAPLVFESFDWDHGVFVGAAMASETTAAATGKQGIVRRDPMAMKPFCGYNMADYWNHWLSFAQKTDKLPKIFHVNWFRKDSHGNFLWPGFGENIRVLDWIIRRCQENEDAVISPIGYLPQEKALDLLGVNITPETYDALLSIDRLLWIKEISEIVKFFGEFENRLPQELWHQIDRVTEKLISK